MGEPCFDDLAEHRSYQEIPWGRSEMRKRLTCQSLMGYETLIRPMLGWPLDTFGAGARALRAMRLKIQGWRDSWPQKGTFPGRD